MVAEGCNHPLPMTPQRALEKCSIADLYGLPEFAPNIVKDTEGSLDFDIILLDQKNADDLESYTRRRALEGRTCSAVPVSQSGSSVALPCAYSKQDYKKVDSVVTSGSYDEPNYIMRPSPKKQDYEIMLPESDSSVDTSKPESDYSTYKWNQIINRNWPRGIRAESVNVTENKASNLNYVNFAMEHTSDPSVKQCTGDPISRFTLKSASTSSLPKKPRYPDYLDLNHASVLKAANRDLINRYARRNPLDPRRIQSVPDEFVVKFVDGSGKNTDTVFNNNLSYVDMETNVEISVQHGEFLASPVPEGSEILRDIHANENKLQGYSKRRDHVIVMQDCNENNGNAQLAKAIEVERSYGTILNNVCSYDSNLTEKLNRIYNQNRLKRYFSHAAGVGSTGQYQSGGRIYSRKDLCIELDELKMSNPEDKCNARLKRTNESFCESQNHPIPIPSPVVPPQSSNDLVTYNAIPVVTPTVQRSSITNDKISPCNETRLQSTVVDEKPSFRNVKFTKTVTIYSSSELPSPISTCKPVREDSLRIHSPVLSTIYNLDGASPNPPNVQTKTSNVNHFRPDLKGGNYESDSISSSKVNSEFRLCSKDSSKEYLGKQPDIVKCSNVMKGSELNTPAGTIKTKSTSGIFSVKDLLDQHKIPKSKSASVLRMNRSVDSSIQGEYENRLNKMRSFSNSSSEHSPNYMSMHGFASNKSHLSDGVISPVAFPRHPFSSTTVLPTVPENSLVNTQSSSWRENGSNYFEDSFTPHSSGDNSVFVRSSSYSKTRLPLQQRNSTPLASGPTSPVAVQDASEMSWSNNSAVTARLGYAKVPSRRELLRHLFRSSSLAYSGHPLLPLLRTLVWTDYTLQKSPSGASRISHPDSISEVIAGFCKLNPDLTAAVAAVLPRQLAPAAHHETAPRTIGSLTSVDRVMLEAIACTHFSIVDMLAEFQASSAERDYRVRPSCSYTRASKTVSGHNISTVPSLAGGVYSHLGSAV